MIFLNKYSKPRIVSSDFIGPKCKDVFLRLPFIGDKLSGTICKRVRNATKQAYPAANPRFLFNTKRIPVRSLKDPVPLRSRSHVIYNFQCDCGHSYIGRTDRNLGTRIKEHLPRWLQSTNRAGRNPASSVCKHAVDCDDFVGRDFISYFSVLASSSCFMSLRILEALFIKRLKPPLCVQKEFVYGLILPW